MTKMFENALKSVQPDGETCGYSKIPSSYDMGYEDFAGLLRLANSDEYDAAYKAIIRAFHFGFVMGNRATISRKLPRL